MLIFTTHYLTLSLQEIVSFCFSIASFQPKEIEKDIINLFRKIFLEVKEWDFIVVDYDSVPELKNILTGITALEVTQVSTILTPFEIYNSQELPQVG